MPQTIYIKDYDTEVTIPDGADMKQVQAALQKQFPNKNKIERQVPQSFLQRAAGAAAPYARPALEYGGALAGGVAGAGAGPLGSIAGAGLGYAAGRQGANALEEFAGIKQNSTLPEAAKNALIDTGTGATMEMGGQIGDKAIQYAGEKLLVPTARKIYESAMKIPPSVQKSVRDRAISTGLRKEIPVNEKGLSKVEGRIEELNSQIAKGIDDLTASQKLADKMNTKLGYRTYDENKVNMKDVVSRMDDLKDFYRKSAPNPKPYIDSINQYKKEVLQARGTEMFADKAQQLKQGIYALHRKHYGEMKGLDIEMDKAIARGLKEEIVKKYPQLESLNAEDSALLNLQTFLERAVNRSRNYDIVRLGDQIMSVGGAVAGGPAGGALAGATKHVLGLPGVKSRIAFAMNKAGRYGAPTLSRAIAYPIGQAIGQPGMQQGLNAISPNTAEAATLADYARGTDNPRARALREAANEPDNVPRGTPQAQTAPQVAPKPNMTPQQMAAYQAETDRLRKQFEAKRNEPAKPKKHINVRRVTIHNPDGDEIKYMDDKGKLYDNDPNE